MMAAATQGKDKVLAAIQRIGMSLNNVEDSNDMLSSFSIFDNRLPSLLRITITYSSRGRTHQDLIDCLDTIAQNGTAKFLKALKESKDVGVDSNLIGQFGLGFDSAFLISQRIEVSTKSPRYDKQGIRLTLYLKHDDKGFAHSERIQKRVLPIMLCRSRNGDIEMASVASRNQTVKEIFKDYSTRHAGIIRTLTYDVDEGCGIYDPEREILCLYGHPNETREVNLSAEEVPPEPPEPALGTYFARDGMNQKDWLSLIPVHRDCWLLSLAFYLGARLNRHERKRLFSVINDLPIVFEVVRERKTLKDKLYVVNEAWIGCDICEQWYHGKCVKNLTVVELIPPSIFATDYTILEYKRCAKETLRDPNGVNLLALSSLFGTLIAQTSTLEFYETTAGSGHTAITGPFLCSGDLSNVDGYSCVSRLPILIDKFYGQLIAAGIHPFGCYMFHEASGLVQISGMEILIFRELKQSTGNAFGSASLRRNYVKRDVLHMLSGIWKTSTESGFIWLGGF